MSLIGLEWSGCGRETRELELEWSGCGRETSGFELEFSVLFLLTL